LNSFLRTGTSERSELIPIQACLSVLKVKKA
jgi:hypothetical protein